MLPDHKIRTPFISKSEKRGKKYLSSVPFDIAGKVISGLISMNSLPLEIKYANTIVSIKMSHSK